METASIVASFVSLIVSGLAIWMSLYFYTQSKNSERAVQVALEGIKAQTDALQALNARTLDRLTKYVTTPRDEPSQTIQILYAAIRDLPEMALKLRPHAPQAVDEGTRRELIQLYIALWNYTATTNVWVGFRLPNPQDFNDQDNFHCLIKTVVDRSAADFRYMTTIIEQIRPEDLRACAPSIIAFYDEVQTRLRPLVGDTAHHFAQRAKQEQPNA